MKTPPKYHKSPLTQKETCPACGHSAKVKDHRVEYDRTQCLLHVSCSVCDAPLVAYVSLNKEEK